MTIHTKKILIFLPDLRGGGAERMRVNLANEWVHNRYIVEFVLMKKRGELLSLLSPDIKIISLEVDQIRQVILPLRNYLIDSQPDIILSAMWPLTSATVFSWVLSGKRGNLFLSDHNQLSISCLKELKISPIFLKLLMRATYPFATGIIAVSQGVKKDLCRLGSFSENQVKVIYNPAATGMKPQRRTSKIDTNLWGTGFKHHILSVGSLKIQKDHATLIRAFAKLPTSFNAKLTILGDGTQREQLENLISALELQGRVSLPGFVVDPYPWFSSADLFVLSSSWEGFGNVLVESLECGVPVISTDCPSGPSEILQNGRYGQMVPVGDISRLTNTIIRSLNQVPDRNLLMSRAKSFSVKKIADQYLSFFKSSGN